MVKGTFKLTQIRGVEDEARVLVFEPTNENEVLTGTIHHVLKNPEDAKNFVLNREYIVALSDGTVVGEKPEEPQEKKTGGLFD